MGRELRVIQAGTRMQRSLTLEMRRPRGKM
jgi:hypothetical protein